MTKIKKLYSILNEIPSRQRVVVEAQPLSFANMASGAKEYLGVVVDKIGSLCMVQAKWQDISAYNQLIELCAKSQESSLYFLGEVDSMPGINNESYQMKLHAVAASPKVILGRKNYQEQLVNIIQEELPQKQYF